jgi:glycosyltransferase involved in cell wall biosynthesis
MKKVMVFVPVYNRITYIKECLDSVISQTYPNQEIIVGDNCSTDGSIEYVKEHYPSVNILRATKHYPKVNPLTNDAVRESDCEYFTILGSDDKFCPNYWETLLPLFDTPDVGFVRVGCYQFGEHNPNGTWWRPPGWGEPQQILVANTVFQSSPIRKECWELEGGVDINCVWGDWDFWIRAVLAGWQWRTYEKPMYWYRRHLQQGSVQGTTYSFEERLYLIRKWLPTLEKFKIKMSMLVDPTEQNMNVEWAAEQLRLYEARGQYETDKLK